MVGYFFFFNSFFVFFFFPLKKNLVERRKWWLQLFCLDRPTYVWKVKNYQTYWWKRQKIWRQKLRSQKEEPWTREIFWGWNTKKKKCWYPRCKRGRISWIFGEILCYMLRFLWTVMVLKWYIYIYIFFFFRRKMGLNVDYLFITIIFIITKVFNKIEINNVTWKSFQFWCNFDKV